MRWLFELAGVTYLRYTVLTSSNKSETVVHCCDPPLSVLVMLVSRNVFHVVSALQSIVFILFGGLIRSLADPTLAALIVCGPLQLVTLLCTSHLKPPDPSPPRARAGNSPFYESESK